MPWPGTTRPDSPAIRKLVPVRLPSCRKVTPIPCSAAWPGPKLLVPVGKRLRQSHPRSVADVWLVLAVDTSGIFPHECETPSAPLAVQVSRSDTGKPLPLPPVPLRSGDTSSARVLRLPHRWFGGRDDDTGVRTFSLVCVQVFGDMLWGAAARKAPLAVLRCAALLLTTRADVRSLS